MELDFSPEEIRVLGCLIEKERTTPEHYPLSLNSLRLACNQKTSREPVVDFEEEQVTAALESLRERKLVYYVRQAGARVTKYRHDVTVTLQLQPDELTVFGLLLLRGAQTLGELRNRSDRMYAFESIEEVEQTVQRLIEYEGDGLARIQPRRPGQKEKRIEHALMPATEPSEYEVDAIALEPSPRVSSATEAASLRSEVEALTARVAELEARFTAFQQQFE
ncbi:YceH family protein [Cerasicoccus arenae]|uniref:UPF0502 protein n=1 Tax=Cerasicoccus arenae TaxID=424488 RepID=A0A8J3GCX1_9BACT|nr:YceH family protein [Cerasicoccus arenae]MBK1857147.1 YceH family protein [Cerasicoccus arenae]GHB92633.1 UPF0502 protein [Cerasicoccus arenae]